ncbi:MAG TPA: hypothetical protein VGJ44_19905 [Kribbellaceae bacterium]
MPRRGTGYRSSTTSPSTGALSRTSDIAAATSGMLRAATAAARIWSAESHLQVSV